MQKDTAKPVTAPAQVIYKIKGYSIGTINVVKARLNLEQSEQFAKAHDGSLLTVQEWEALRSTNCKLFGEDYSWGKGADGNGMCFCIVSPMFFAITPRLSLMAARKKPEFVAEMLVYKTDDIKEAPQRSLDALRK